MNFCGGGVEQQVHEPPIVTLGRHHRHHHNHHLEDDDDDDDEDLMIPTNINGNPYYHHQQHHQVDLPVHPSCVVTSSHPQQSSSNNKGATTNTSSGGGAGGAGGILKMTKKKLLQQQKSNASSTTPPRSRSRSRSRSRGRQRSRAAQLRTLEEQMSGMEIITTTRQQHQHQQNNSTSTSTTAMTTNTYSHSSHYNTTTTMRSSVPSPRMLNPLSPQRILAGACTTPFATEPPMTPPILPFGILGLPAAFNHSKTTTITCNPNSTHYTHHHHHHHHNHRTAGTPTLTSPPACMTSKTGSTTTEQTTSTTNHTSGILGLPAFSNMKTLDTLLKRLENGFRVTIHNGTDPGGKRVFLTLLQNRTSLMIRPVAIEGDDGTSSSSSSTPSVKFPVRTILRLEIGKTKSSVLGRPIYDHVHPMTCFSIVVKLWTDAETYFDFEASSVIEREALISTLMVVLDQMHNSPAPSPAAGAGSAGGIGGSNMTTYMTTTGGGDNTTTTNNGPAWLHPRKTGQALSSPSPAPTTAAVVAASAAENRHAVSDGSMLVPDPPTEICLSPGKRTKIYSSTFFENGEGDGEEQQGTEISLVYSGGIGGTNSGGLRSPRASNNSGTVIGNSKAKPLRQRQLQPVAVDDDTMNPHPFLFSTPRTPRAQRHQFASPRDSSAMNIANGAAKPNSSILKTAISPDATITTTATNSHKSLSRHNGYSPLEVVNFERYAVDAPESPAESQQAGGEEQRDANNSFDEQDGGIVILDTSHPNQPATEIELGLGSPDGGDLHRDLSFEIAQKGLPVSKIQFSQTRDNFDPQIGCCSLAPTNMDQMNGGNGNGGGSSSHPVAWCSDDICTLALKDIAETCTGIFDHHPDSFPRDPSMCFRGGDNNSTGGPEQNAQAAAERAYVEEYIAGVLGGPNGALGAFFPDGDVWNVDSSKQAGGRNNNNGKVKVNRIKNRASSLNAQAMRLRTLRNEMTFAAALKRSKEKMQYVLTTKSFDDADSERIRQAQEKSVSMLHTSALMERVMGNMVLSKPDTEEDAVYYDSDPEDLRPRTKGARRALANRCNAVEKHEEEQHQNRPVLSGVGFERIAVGKKLRKLDEGLIVQIVQAMRNETLTLMWHPTQSVECPNRSPVCVNLWIESGVYLIDGSFLLPRLSWSVAYENNLGAKKLNVSKTEPDQIDLLDVCRIRVTEKIDRKLHPFPDPRKSFMIETQDEIYLFEAQTADERNRIVYGYKLVIARLASLLMLRDSRAVEEFFGSASAMVPGGFAVGK